MHISGLGHIGPLAPQTLQQDRNRPEAEPGFGPAVLRSAMADATHAMLPDALQGATPQAALYGPDGTLAGGPARENPSESRLGKTLERRDTEVRQTERAKGEAVGGSEFIYQAGPDGELYAIGTRPHLVKKEEAADGNGLPPGTGLEENADTRENRELLQRLQRRDAHVKAHENAHVMAAGGQAGPVSYTYQTGPDGRSYAIGGSVNISVASSGDPEEAARQAGRAQRAAMANGEMSAADAQTARRAGEISGKARAAALEKYEAMRQLEQ